MHLPLVACPLRGPRDQSLIVVGSFPAGDRETGGSGITEGLGGSHGKDRLIVALLLSLAPSGLSSGRPAGRTPSRRAKASKKLAVLVFFNKGLKDCQKFEAETLPELVGHRRAPAACLREDRSGRHGRGQRPLAEATASARPPMTLRLRSRRQAAHVDLSALKAEHLRRGRSSRRRSPPISTRSCPAREALGAGTPARRTSW